VKVRLFAALREIAGSSLVDVEPSDAADAASLVAALSARYGEEFGRVARAGAVVVNGERVGPGRRLGPADDVTLLPPVSGGSA